MVHGFVKQKQTQWNVFRSKRKLKVECTIYSVIVHFGCVRCVRSVLTNNTTTNNNKNQNTSFLPSPVESSSRILYYTYIIHGMRKGLSWAILYTYYYMWWLIAFVIISRIAQTMHKMWSIERSHWPNRIAHFIRNTSTKLEMNTYLPIVRRYAIHILWI